MQMNPKSLALYAGMITFAVVSYAIIADYGTKNLTAQEDISGKYVLTLESSSDCFTTAVPPLLVIGQSGGYLNADVVSSDAAPPVLRRALVGNGKLNGRVIEQKVRVESPSVALGSCSGKQPLLIEATVDKDMVKGQLTWQGVIYPFTGSKKVSVA